MPINIKVNYFPHDYGARFNPKLISLQMAMGGLGLAIFWCVVEMLWENAGYYPCDYSLISFHLHWATPADVRRVVEEFDLFETDGEMFWSETVHERLKLRNDISDKRAESGRAGGLQSGVSRRKKAIASGSGSKAEAIASTSGSNKELIEKKNDKNNESQNLTDDEKMLIFELFFWENYMSPKYEADRFWEHYEKTGWTTSDGKPIQDKEQIAKYWKVEKIGKRFDPNFLSWYQGVVNAARNHLVTYDVNQFLLGLVRVILKGNDLAITYSSRELAEVVSAFVIENNLSGSYKIDWRFENK